MLISHSSSDSIVMNNTNSCDVTQDIIKGDIQILLKPQMVLMPGCAVLYGYQLTKLYKKYKNSLTAIDIFELNCLGDRTLVLLLWSIMKFGILQLGQDQVCYALKFLILAHTESFQADFLMSQIELFWFIRLGPLYPSDSRHRSIFWKIKRGCSRLVGKIRWLERNR